MDKKDKGKNLKFRNPEKEFLTLFVFYLRKLGLDFITKYNSKITHYIKKKREIFCEIIIKHILK